MRPFVLPLALACLAFAGRASGELIVPHYDLESLYARSGQIVRAEVADAGTVTVMAVYKGEAKPGDTIQVTPLTEYKRSRTPAHDEETYEPLRAGDTVYLFLEPDARQTGAARQIISCGIYLLDGGQVYGFGQYFPRPSPRHPMVMGSLGLVTMTRLSFPNVVVPGRKEFEARLRASPQRIETIGQLANAPRGEETKRRVLEALRERLAAEQADQAWVDELGDRLAFRYDDLATPQELDAFLDEADTNATRFSLVRGFRSAEGRAYLVRQIADAKVSVEKRERYASYLRDIGWDYRREARDRRLNPTGIDLAAGLARAAVEKRGTPTFQPLLDALVQAVDTEAPAGSELAADGDTAALILTNAFPGASAREQYGLAEVLMRIRPAQYKAVLPAGGPMLTLIEPGRGFTEGLPRRVLRLDCRFRNQRKAKSTLKLVFKPVDGGAEVLSDLSKQIGDMTDTFGYAWQLDVVIPECVVGAQHVLLRDFVDGRPAGDGLGFDLTLPRP